MRKTVEMDFEFMATIPGPPASPKEMYAQACSSDGVTVNHWRDIWIDNTKANHEKYGPFRDKSIGKLFGRDRHKPVVVIGSGPSLASNVDDLKLMTGIAKVSCLHNYHYMVDHGIDVDFYVSLDAGRVTLEEISEGGNKSEEEYLESTRGKTLLAYVGSHPDLLKSWRGEILFFTCALPDQETMGAYDAIEPFHVFVSTGGNVLGACTYIAKAILGANPIVFMGADFSFSYTKKFHAWDSKYDRDIGHAIRAIDVWGNRVLTWQSYYNFKTWFDWLVCNIPGHYINCTEGGLLGAYPEGNIAQVQQMRLKDLARIYSMHEELRKQCEDPATEERKLLF